MENIMNEAETRAELIEPKLKEAGWGLVEGSKILREYQISAGEIKTGGRGKKDIADFILVYKGIKLAVVEAKKRDLSVGEGVMQAKKYAHKLQLTTTYSSNGREIYQICMQSGEEGLVERFMSPQALWAKNFPHSEEAEALQEELWRERFALVPFDNKSGSWDIRYYQEIAVNKVIETLLKRNQRILLTLATGTGKTAIAFQIVWKLFQARWNLQLDGGRRPRILFLADRNILADQAYNSFSAFPEDALVRIKPNQIKKTGKVPTNGSIFFTIFQTFMSGTDAQGQAAPYFGEYSPNFFDFIIIDECHRGGASDESNWRAILEYFSPAVQLGLTATPKRKDNVDTYQYFGEPVYVYSLKEGIKDGFLTPFKVKRIKTTLDDYRYATDDMVLEGEIEQEKLYEEKDFNRTIEIREREAKRVSLFLEHCNQKEKAIIFCANQEHAALVRDLVNQQAKSKNPFYCVRVTANDGEEGERYLREFQNNERTVPTILTTSQKLSTGVDARNIRNIVLMRPINSMIEFKQIVGRGTRIYEGKEFFTIYDFVDAYKHFSDPEWDGEPIYEESSFAELEQAALEEEAPDEDSQEQEINSAEQTNRRQKVRVRLRTGKVREIQTMISTSFWSGGKMVSAQEFLENIFGELPKFLKDEEELLRQWSNPITRKTLLQKLDEAGFPQEELRTLQKLVDMEHSDLYDVLEYIFNEQHIALSREQRAKEAESRVFALLNERQKDFIAFVLSKYIEVGVEELDQEKLPTLLTNKYESLEDALNVLGNVEDIKNLFINFQEHLYKSKAA